MPCGLQQPAGSPAAAAFSSASASSTAASSEGASATPADSPVALAQFPPACQTPLPAGVSVVRAFVQPPPAPALTAAEVKRLQARESFGDRVDRWTEEYREQLVRKITEPHKVIWEAYGAAWTLLWRRWSRRVGYVTRIMQRPAVQKLVEFGPDTDLRAFTLLNDNNFGGSTVCGLELRERVERDASGKEVKKYSVVFKGELRTLMPIDPDSLNPAPGRKMPTRMENVNAPELLSKPAAMDARPQDSGPSFAAAASAAAAAAAPSPAAPAFPSAPSASSSPLSDLDPVIAPRSSAADTSAAANAAVAAAAAAAASSATPRPSMYQRPRDTDLEDTTPTEKFFGRPLGPAEWAQGYGRSEEGRPVDGTAESAAQQISTQAAVGAANTGASSPGLRLMPRSFSERLAASGSTGPINGFAAVILPPFPRPDLDLEWFDFLALRLRTDGRRYIFNVRAHNSVLQNTNGYIWQSQLRAESLRPMHKKEVRLENFMCTQHGRAKNFGSPLPRERIESFGFSVTGPPGPFELELELVEARCGVPEFELRAEWEARQAQLAERERRIGERIAQQEQRARVHQELQRLRAERAAAGSPADFDRTVLAALVQGDTAAAAQQQKKLRSKAQREQQEEESAFPREFHEQQVDEAAAHTQRELRSLKRQQAQVKAQAGALTDAQREEIAKQVDDQMALERDEDPDLLPFGKRRPKEE